MYKKKSDFSASVSNNLCNASVPFTNNYVILAVFYHRLMNKCCTIVVSLDSVGMRMAAFLHIVGRQFPCCSLSLAAVGLCSFYPLLFVE